MISIIISTYNGTAYIRKCLDALINQAIDSNLLQIIVVDDASVDNTVNIVEEYKAKYEGSFKLIKNKLNSSKTFLSPRNIGYEAADGKYIMFCDQDDWYEKDAVRYLFEKMEKNEMLDYIEYRFKTVDINGELIKSKKYETEYEELSITEEQLIELVEKRKFPGYAYAWNKIYRKSFLEKNDIWHNEGDIFTGYSDNFFTGLVCAYAKRIGKVYKPLYNYRVWGGSYTHNICTGYYELCDRIKTGRMFFDECKKRDLQKTKKSIVYLMFFKISYEKVFVPMLLLCGDDISYDNLKELKTEIVFKCPDWDTIPVLAARKKLSEILNYLPDDWSTEQLAIWKKELLNRRQNN